MEFERQNLATLFTKTNRLEIPFFQRAYVWNEPHLRRLLEDVEDVCSTKRPYFMGVLILKQGRTPTGGGDVRLVIDGQQRLTALSILCKVLCLKNSTLKKFNDSFRLQDGSIVLKHNDYDCKVYEQIMSLERLEEIESENNVAKTYKYFCDNLKPEKLDFDHIYTSINFANIDLSEEEEEQEIFDTINTVDAHHLTPVESLKNYFFSRGKKDRAKYEKYWKNVFEKDEATRSYWNREAWPREKNIDIFFFSYLQIKFKRKEILLDVKSSPLREESLSGFYRHFTRAHKDIPAILDEVLEYSKCFKNAIDRKKLEKPLPTQGVERINAIIFSLNMTRLVPYILFVEKNVKDEREKNKLYDYLEAYIIRQLLDFGSPSTLYGGMFISEGVLSYNDLQGYLEKQRKRKKFDMLSDKDFRRSFHNAIVRENGHAKMILYLMESKIREPEYQSTQLLGMSEYTLEHIMPRKWKEERPPTSDSYERRRKLETFGNLTIVPEGLNSLLANRPWTEKRVELREHAKDIKTLCGALEKEQWNEDAIDERAEKLADLAIKIWPGI